MRKAKSPIKFSLEPAVASDLEPESRRVLKVRKRGKRDAKKIKKKTRRLRATR